MLPVTPPYRLDLTADALRRLAANVVDRLDADGTYRRVLLDERGANPIAVRQASARHLKLVIEGPAPERWVPVVERMLGTRVQLAGWRQRTKPFPWLEALARDLRGVHPPRYPTLFEALAHAIVFQQISIHAASSIMRRLVEALSLPVLLDGGPCYPFFTAPSVLSAPEDVLRGAGLSANKASHLRSAAAAVAERTIREEEIEALPSAQAAQRLAAVRGIGPWSAAVVLLRGFGRLDVFPMNDSGVARSIKALSGNEGTDAAALIEALGPLRGMLYFHLLLGRTRNL